MDEREIKTVSILELLKPFRQNWVIVVVAWMAVFFTVAFFTLRTAPVYEATATFFMRKSGDMQNQIFDIPSVVMQKYVIKNQVAILKSRNLASDVALRLKSSVYHDSLSLFGNGKPQNSRSGFLAKLSSLVSSRKTLLKPSFTESVDALQNSIEVTYGEDTDIIEMKGRAGSSWEAAVLVNAWVDTYQDIDRTDLHSELAQTDAFLDRKLTDIRQKLRQSEEALGRYQDKNKMVSLTTETETLVEQASTFESLYNQTRIDLEAVNRQLEYLSAQLDESKRTLVEDMTKISSPALQELQRQMADLIMEKAAYEAQIIGAGYDLDNDPKLKQMENRLGGVKEKITEEAQKLLKNNLSGLNPLDRSQQIISELFDLRTQRESLNAKEKSLKGIVDQYNQKLLGLPQKNIELIRLERDVQVNSKIYEMVKEKTEELKIRDLGNQAFIHIVDRASPPTRPILPRTAFNLALGFLFGLFFGLGLAFARGFFEDTIRSPEDLQRLSVDVMAGVPAHSRPRLNWIADKSNWTLFRAKQIFPYLLLQRNGNYEISEVYRTASTKLYLSKKKTGLKSILFTSPNPSEGKSTTVANVAIAMANRGVKTLLVDSDLRGPVLDVLFLGGQRQNGLTHVLGGHIEWSSAVRETSVKGLFIMPAGAMVKNAPEILGSALMRQFHTQARKEFGLVLFDSPPVLPVADAMILASLVDGIVLVVKASKTTRTQVKKSLELLTPLNPHIIGGIINGLHQHDLTEYRAYYRSYFDSVDSRKKPA